VFLEAEMRSKGAQTISGNTDADLPIGERLPAFRRLRITLILFETGDDFSVATFRSLLSSRLASQSRHTEQGARTAHSVQKAPPRHADAVQVLDQVLALFVLSFVAHDSFSFSFLF